METSVPYGFVEDTLQIPLRQRGALEVFDGFDLFGDRQRLLIRHRLHLFRAQVFCRRFVFAEVELRADEDDGHVGRVMFDFGMPL